MVQNAVVCQLTGHNHPSDKHLAGLQEAPIPNWTINESNNISIRILYLKRKANLSTNCHPCNSPITWMQHTLHLNGSQYKGTEKGPRQNTKGLRRLIQLMWFFVLYICLSPLIAAPSHALSVRLSSVARTESQFKCSAIGWFYQDRLKMLSIGGYEANETAEVNAAIGIFCHNQEHLWPFRRFRSETICSAYNRNIPWECVFACGVQFYFRSLERTKKKLVRNSKRWPQHHLTQRLPFLLLFSPDLSPDYMELGFGRGQLSAASRAKRMRTSFKHHQLRTMKSYFAINHNPDAKDLKQLSQKTGLPKRVLQVSFVSRLTEIVHHLSKTYVVQNAVHSASIDCPQTWYRALVVFVRASCGICIISHLFWIACTIISIEQIYVPYKLPDYYHYNNKTKI